MTAAETAELLADIDELLAENGRQVTFIRHSPEPEDDDAPWLGPDTSDDDEIDAYAVQAETGTEKRFGRGTNPELQGEMFLLTRTSEDIEGCHQVIDGDQTWAVKDIQVLQPGDTVFLYQVRCRR